MTIALILCAIVWGAVSFALLGSSLTLGVPGPATIVGSILWPLTFPLFVALRWRHSRQYRRFQRATDERVRQHREESAS